MTLVRARACLPAYWGLAANPSARMVTSANVIVGAVLILLMMLPRAFALEATACSIGITNCD